MSNANTINDFATGFFLILAIDFLIFIIGLTVISFIFEDYLSGFLSIFWIVTIGICQYIYVIPTIIWRFIERNSKFAYGFLFGSLAVLSISIAISKNFEDSFGKFMQSI